MDSKAQRRQRTAEYKQTHPGTGVYRLINTQTGRALLGSAANLQSVRSKLDSPARRDRAAASAIALSPTSDATARPPSSLRSWKCWRRGRR